MRNDLVLGSMSFSCRLWSDLIHVIQEKHLKAGVSISSGFGLFSVQEKQRSRVWSLTRTRALKQSVVIEAVEEESFHTLAIVLAGQFLTEAEGGCRCVWNYSGVWFKQPPTERWGVQILRNTVGRTKQASFTLCNFNQGWDTVDTVCVYIYI